MIVGSWALSLAVAGAIVSQKRYQTVAQKVDDPSHFMSGKLMGSLLQIVQARMWAQGLTVGVVIGAGALTHTQRAEAAKHVGF